VLNTEQFLDQASRHDSIKVSLGAVVQVVEKVYRYSPHPNAMLAHYFSSDDIDLSSLLQLNRQGILFHFLHSVINVDAYQ
jgi:hypothetical protein